MAGPLGEAFGNPVKGGHPLVAEFAAVGGFVGKVEDGCLVVTFCDEANGTLAVSISIDVAGSLVDLVGHQMARSLGGLLIGSENVPGANFPAPAQES
jgi:hypothetical protein